MTNITLKELLKDHFVDITKILIKGVANNQPTKQLFKGTVSEALKLFENDPENSTYQNSYCFTFQNDCITEFDIIRENGVCEAYIIIYVVINSKNKIQK